MSDVDTSARKRRRSKRWPEALKREIVAATRQPGASVSVVARQYDVNANQVFRWRHHYRDAHQQSILPAPSPTPMLVPVTVTPEREDAPLAPSTLAALDTIEIEVSDQYRIRVGSRFDGRALERVLDVLRKR